MMIMLIVFSCCKYALFNSIIMAILTGRSWIFRETFVRKPVNNLMKGLELVRVNEVYLISKARAGCLFPICEDFEGCT